MICRTLSIYWLLWYPKPISSPSIHRIFQEKAGETRTEFLIEETKQRKTTTNKQQNHTNKQEPKWNQQSKILPKGLRFHFELNKEGYKNTAVLLPPPCTSLLSRAYLITVRLPVPVLGLYPLSSFWAHRQSSLEKQPEMSWSSCITWSFIAGKCCCLGPCDHGP